MIEQGREKGSEVNGVLMMDEYGGVANGVKAGDEAVVGTAGV